MSLNQSPAEEGSVYTIGQRSRK